MGIQEANNILAIAQEQPVSIGASVHLASISYDKTADCYSILLPGYEPRSFTPEQARSFLVASGHSVIVEIDEWTPVH